MIDNDLSHQLHSLAATVNEPFDLAALHRRISLQNRRRATVKVGFAGASVAAVVGGLIVVQQDRQSPVESSAAASSPVASTAPQVDPTPLPACDTLLAAMRTAKSTSDTVVPKDVRTNGASGNGPTVDFKGIVTILTIDGLHFTFSKDEPKVTPPTTGVTTLDAETMWTDGPTQLDSPATLQVGEQVGLATKPGSDGVEHALFIDVGAHADTASKPVPDTKLATPRDSSTTGSDPSTPDTTIVVPGGTLPPGPTEKAIGKITDVGTSSITVSLSDRSGQARTFDIDLATTPFYADDTHCLPGALTVGASLGVAFHFGDASNVVADEVMLMP